MYIRNENNVIFKLIKAISKEIYSSADEIIVQSKSFMSYLSSTHNIPEGKMVYIPAFAGEEYLHEDFSPEDNGTVDYVFLGNIGIAQDVSAVVDAFQAACEKTEGIILHIVGDGSCLEKIRAQVEKYGLTDKVLFYGRRPVEEMPKYYKLADACLVTLKPGSAVGLTLPSKVQGYMAAGKPIIGMIDGSAKEVIRESGCGICVPAGAKQELAEAFIEFANNPQRYAECGKNARRYFLGNFRQSIFMDEFEKEIRKVKR